MNKYKDIIKFLPDYIRKNGSNFKKILQIISNREEEIINVLEELKKCDDIDYSYGYNLDRLAENYAVYRPKDYLNNDIRFKKYLKARVTAMFNHGNIDSIKNLLAVVFDRDKESFIIKDLPESGTFELIMPSNISGNEIKENLDIVRAAGVGYSLKSYVVSQIGYKGSSYKMICKYDKKPFKARKDIYVNTGLVAKQYISQDQLIISTIVNSNHQHLGGNK